MITGEINTELQPLPKGFKWRSPTLDCQKCWPRWGWGYRPTRKGKQHWLDGVQINVDDIKGVCFTCQGTGLVALPFAETLKSSKYWDMDDVQEWLYEEHDDE